MSEERKELTAEELAALGIQRGSDALLRKLHEPFPAAAFGWKPQSVKGNRALAIAYIDVRDVMERLDDVVGPASWEDDYKLISAPNEKPSFLCRLRIRLGERWISKRDVGGCSDQPDAATGSNRLARMHSSGRRSNSASVGICTACRIIGPITTRTKSNSSGRPSYHYGRCRRTNDAISPRPTLN
jgi:hypothetical protein